MMPAAEKETARMKLNFWQWLGIALLIIGVIWFLWSRGSKGGDPRIRTSAQSTAG
jgi:drug/metabolite transporter (DMT)-like permease